MKAIRKLIDHYQGTSFAAFVGIALFFWVYGCQSRVRSIVNPTVKVNRQELELEIEQEMAQLQNATDKLIATGNIRLAELDKLDEAKRKFAELGLAFVKEGKINPVGIATVIAGLLGVGFAVDNRAKDKVIKTNNKNNKVNNGKG